MNGDSGRTGRGATSVIGTVLLVAVVVLLASVVTVFALDLGESTQPVAPQITVSHEVVDDGGDEVVAVTMATGEAVDTDHLYVMGSQPLDIGGAPDSATPADDRHASSREAFNESTSPTSQVDVGDTWDAGETVYLDPVGDTDDLTIEFYWTTQPVAGYNPGDVQGEDSYLIAEVTL